MGFQAEIPRITSRLILLLSFKLPIGLLHTKYAGYLMTDVYQKAMLE